MTDDQYKFYCLGKRDALATLFSLIRAEGEQAALKDLAEVLAAVAGNPHAKWFLNQLTDNANG